MLFVSILYGLLSLCETSTNRWKTNYRHFVTKSGRIMLLHRNLAAIAKVNPTLAKRIAWPVEGAHIVQEKGTLLYRIEHEKFVIQLSARQKNRFTQQCPQGKDILLWGSGIGDMVDVLLSRNNRLVVWERDSWLLRTMLAYRDFSEDIRTGRLELLLGVDIVARAKELSTWQRVSHPFFTRHQSLEIV